MKLAEIASRINAHLERFEADPKINTDYSGNGLHKFYHAASIASGRYVGIVYVNCQGLKYMAKDRAESYLAWLDAGGIGTHYEAERRDRRLK